MLSRSEVAQESRTVHRSYSAADSSSDVVVTHGDVSDERSEHIKRSTHAERFLYLHVCCDLIERHMPRTLDHYLDVVIPCALCQLTESYELLDLAYVSGVCQTSRTACISERYSDIVLFADIEDLVVIFVERILFPGHAHPCEYKAAS